MTSVNPLLDAIGAVVMAIAVLTSLVAVWSLLPRLHRLRRRG
jgi:predicted RND superfamily exporter protein